MGFPDSGGKRPYIISLNTLVQDGAVNGNGGTACVLATHSNCFLSGDEMPYLGTGGTPGNPAGIQGIDSMISYQNKLYMANNGGLIRSAITSPLDYGNNTGHWENTPSVSLAEVGNEPAHLTNTIRLFQTGDLTRRMLGYPQMAIYYNELYVIRNGCANATSGANPSCATPATNMRPQLWRYNGTTDTWTRMNQTSGITNFGDANNLYVSMIVRNGGTDASGGALYIGFDNDVGGLAAYRSVKAGHPDAQTDWTGLNGDTCPAAPALCNPIASTGWGGGNDFSHVLDAISVDFAGNSYMYITVGNASTTKLRVYRQLN